jgi:nucleoid-associated protein YgaU
MRSGVGRGVLTAALVTAAFATPARAQTLRGSWASINLQHQRAEQHDFTFLRHRAQLQRFVDAGLLVPLTGGAHYRLHEVSFNVARPEVKLFVERLASQYLAACGEPLVVTSLTRPASLQPENASALSVHPTGMAVDLRLPATLACRTWLESTLLMLERRRVLEATREHSPAHIHVAVFPNAYLAYVARQTGRSESALLDSVLRPARHTVRRSDTLSEIAARYETTPARIKALNGLKSDVIRPGQTLRIPGGN